jgi:hypothetical protein
MYMHAQWESNKPRLHMMTCLLRSCFMTHTYFVFFFLPVLVHSFYCTLTKRDRVTRQQYAAEKRIILHFFLNVRNGNFNITNAEGYCISRKLIDYKQLLALNMIRNNFCSNIVESTHLKDVCYKQ